MDWTRWTG
jgi:hypothetical protein